MSYAAKGMDSKVIVFGGGGQLGVELCREFERREWTVLHYDRGGVDITDREKVEQAVASTDPQVVVNAAAYNQVDIAEREPLTAYQTNALAVRNLAMACRQTGARLVHYSTDYVFDGTKGSAYVETDQTHR
jgi:dTDP-4-dehydrorhamnose reductase